MISKNYRLDIPTNFRTKEWAENELISGFYKYFSNKDNINTTNRIEVDFCKCIWIDPWPIMSLITFFAHHIIPYSKEVLFIFPKPQIIVPLFGGDVMIDQNKVLRFLLKEGFLSILNDLKVKTNLGQEDIRLIDDFGDILSYSDCHLCESKLINTCSDNIEDVIDEIIQKTAVNLQKRKLSSLYINNLTINSSDYFKTLEETKLCDFRLLFLKIIIFLIFIIFYACSGPNKPVTPKPCELPIQYLSNYPNPITLYINALSLSPDCSKIYFLSDNKYYTFLDLNSMNEIKLNLSSIIPKNIKFNNGSGTIFWCPYDNTRFMNYPTINVLVVH